MMAIALLAGCVAAGATPGGAEEPAPVGVAVETAFLERAAIRNELTYIGQVQPLKTVNIASMLAAEVTSVNFHIGDRVEEGDVLFTVDAQDIRNQVSQLQATMRSMNIGVESAQYNLQLAIDGAAHHRMQEIQLEQGVNQAVAGLRIADENRMNNSRQQRDLRDQLEDAEIELSVVNQQIRAFGENFDRDMYIFNPANPVVFQTLLGTQFGALLTRQAALEGTIRQMEAQLDGLRMANRQAQISQNQAGRGLWLAEDSLHTYREQSMEVAQRQAEFGVRSAQAQLETTQVNLSIAQNNLNRAVITSPISGVVSARNVEVGQFVSQAMMPFAIVQIDTVVVHVSISESLINLVYPGQEVGVVIQALGREETLTGTVSIVSPIANHASTFPVRIELDNADGRIRPGMFSQVTFVEAQSEDAFVAPRSAVLSDETGQFVYVVVDGYAQRRAVQTGLVSGGAIEIISGVTERDQLVVVGQEYLHDGILINVVAVDGQRTS